MHQCNKFESKIKVKLLPKTDEGKKFVSNHGEVLVLLYEGMYSGKIAAFVESLDGKWSGQVSSKDVEWSAIC